MLRGKTGTARLAAATGAPVVPVGLWGTEQVWPAGPAAARRGGGAATRRRCGCASGGRSASSSTTPRHDTELLMSAISELLPASAAPGPHGRPPASWTGPTRPGPAGRPRATAAAPVSLPWRTRAGRAATVAVNAVSRRLRLGGGTVVGGRVGLAVDPGLLARLAAGRPVALVSGTNGKTTTTRLLAVALARGRW